MSRAAAVQEPDVEQVVVSRSQYADTVHRPDTGTDDPRPACAQAGADKRREWREVSLASQRPHRSLCRNPACFGGEWW
ncbi:hypothetical protein Hrd1104_00030 [Halorhabdus sp. CBA1104]|uniref:hypothetical protein n=1 Tax=Halorhabdus sp. CBA1104 TaxID=1380432 RepID=UPI0012B24431|nr:hypothetical protein [Halorhabdus sp. CBA1104]QGN05833.1 hypothetical protein Hrd1104_00030 [Halorhabdus sp. CBA1104]